jgi:feruloyl esterase
MVEPGAGDATAAAPTPYCRVQIVLKPSPISNIGVEVWLPERERWNGKFLGTGNGGAAGAIRREALLQGLVRGYAVANTDMGTGSSGLDFSFAVGKPDLMKDFGYRSTAGLTQAGKKITTAFYGRAPEHSYFQGCSTGGHQAWQAAQTLFRDYDGIVAAAPANNRTHIHMVSMHNGALNSRSPASAIPQSKLAMIQSASIAACDAIDGVKDQIISEPQRCAFDPVSIQCQGPDGPQCLTPGQVDTLRMLYAGTRNPRTGALIFAGLEPGAEAGVSLSRTRRAEDGRLIVRNGLMNWSSKFQEAHPDGLGFDFDRDVAIVDADIGRYVNFDNPDLSRFRRGGGKAVLWHGWADSGISPGDSILFYEKIQKANGGPERTAEFARLFMAPGVAHCGGGEGANQFDALGALEAWVEDGIAPQSILATRPASDAQPAITRPLCPYPQVARWRGQGSTNDATNFACSDLAEAH